MSSRIPSVSRPTSTPSPLPRSAVETPGTSQSVQSSTPIGTGSGSLPYRVGNGPTPSRRSEAGETEKVKVFARIRPALRDDETPGALAWSEADGTLTIFRPDAPVPQSDFHFNRILGPTCSQADVYKAAVSDVVEDVLRGYNGTVMAYGQTGAGKTYTLGNTAPAAIGMIPRAAAELFAAAARDPVHSYRITMSYIQIYMEMIQDLLNPTADNLPIREEAGPAGGVFVAGAAEVPVTSLEECLHYLELGEQNRVFAFTHLNAHSSRSHAVVMLTAIKGRKYLTNEERAQAEAPNQDGVVTQKVTVGKLYMVDLAGSERLKKSKSVGLRATEARSINLSLTMLGMCIQARAQDSAHVPFRDSKLTRLLQESLGGNAKTSLILCLSDVRQHADESLQSLQFGARAACVRNKPVVNERLQMRQLTAELLAALEEGHERVDGLEAALTQTKEERDALQAALAKERARSAAIADALRAEADAKHAEAAQRLEKQAELLSTHKQQLGQVQESHGQLELQLARLKAEREAREQAHAAEVAELHERLAAATRAEEAAALAAAAEKHRITAEAASRLAQLEAAAQRQASQLSSRLAAERAAARDQAASIHLALARLQQALGELAAPPAPPSSPSPAPGAPAAAAASLAAGAGMGPNTTGSADIQTPRSRGPSGSGVGSAPGAPAAVAAPGLPRPGPAGVAAMTPGAAALLAAAAAARSRHASTSGSGPAGGSAGGAGGTQGSAGSRAGSVGGGSAVAMLQEVLGLAGGSEAAASSGGASAVLPSTEGAADSGSTGSAVAAVLAATQGGAAPQDGSEPPVTAAGSAGGAAACSPQSFPLLPSPEPATSSHGSTPDVTAMGARGRGLGLDYGAALLQPHPLRLLSPTATAGSAADGAAAVHDPPTPTSRLTPSDAAGEPVAAPSSHPHHQQQQQAVAGLPSSSFQAQAQAPPSSPPPPQAEASMDLDAELAAATADLMADLQQQQQQQYPGSMLHSPAPGGGLRSPAGSGQGDGMGYAAAHAAAVAAAVGARPGSSSPGRSGPAPGMVHLPNGLALGYVPNGLHVTVPPTAGLHAADHAGPGHARSAAATPTGMSAQGPGAAPFARSASAVSSGALLPTASSFQHPAGLAAAAAVLSSDPGANGPHTQSHASPRSPHAGHLHPHAFHRATVSAASPASGPGGGALSPSALSSGLESSLGLSGLGSGTLSAGGHGSSPLAPHPRGHANAHTPSNLSRHLQPGDTASPEQLLAVAHNPAYDVHDSLSEGSAGSACNPSQLLEGPAGSSATSALPRGAVSDSGYAARGLAAAHAQPASSSAGGAPRGLPGPLPEQLLGQPAAAAGPAPSASVATGTAAGTPGGAATASSSTSPLFAGIQVQLDALMEAAGAARRARAGLEARVAEQAAALTALSDEKAALTSSAGDTHAQLQDTCARLSEAEAALRDTEAALEASRAAAAATAAQLEEAAAELAARGEEAVGLAGRLAEAEAALSEREEEGRRLGREVEHLKSELASERSALLSLAHAAERSTEQSAAALARRHELQRQIRAANTVKRAWKVFKLQLLQKKLREEQQAAAAAQTARQEQERQAAARQAAQAARAGQALVQESVVVMRDAVEAILTAFVGRRYQLQARQKLNERVAKMLPPAPKPAAAGAAGAPATAARSGSAPAPLQPRNRATSLSLMLAAATAPMAGGPGGGGQRAASSTHALSHAASTPAPNA